MARLDDDVLAALLLTSPLAGDGPPPLKAREFWALVAEVGDLARLLVEVPTDRADALRLQALLGRATAFAFAVEDAERQGITLLSALDPRYPARLREGLGPQAPPVLHTVGPLAGLSEPLVAIAADDPAGRVDDTALAAARAAAQETADGGQAALTGGFASDLDAAATSAALEAGGNVVGVLSHPLVAQLRRPEVRRAVHGGRLCLVTPFRPDAPWSSTTEAGRATVVAALAERVVTIATNVPAAPSGADHGAERGAAHGAEHDVRWDDDPFHHGAYDGDPGPQAP